MTYNKKDKAQGKKVSKSQYIYDLIYPFFAPNYCEGVIEISQEDKFVVIYVDSELSKNKISAIIDSDFAVEKEYLVVQVM